MLRQPTTILIAAFLMLPQLTWATVQWGPDGEPSEIIYDKEGNSSYILVIQEQAPVFNAPRGSKKVMQASFGMAKHIADKVTHDDGKTYYLIVDFDSESWVINKFLGWISADNVLRDPKPISEKGIALKGLIIHNWQIDTSGHLDISMTHAHKGPSQHDEPNTTVGLFKLFFAFAQKNGYTLLAREASLAIESADTQLLGWVADKNLHFWKTRQAIEFDKTTVDKRKLGVKVFATPDECRDFYLMGKTIEPLAEEDIGVKTPWSPILMRYPIISEGSKQFTGLGNLYQVGVIGDQIYIDKGTAGLTEQELAVMRDKLKELEREMSHIDVLFIIDATGSMGDDYPHVKQAVKTIAQKMKASALKPRFSINFYKDYVDADGKGGDDSYLFKREPLTDNVGLFNSYLDKESASGGGDTPEAIYYAIDQAIHLARSEVREVGFRVAVVIADAPNHSTDPRGYKPAQIANKLANNGYDFFSVESGSAGAFTPQMQEIARLLGSERALTAHFNAKERGNEVANAIIQMALKAIEEAKKSKMATATAGLGSGFQKIQSQYGTRITRRVTEGMQKKGINPRNFISASAQIFQPGWVTVKEPGTGIQQVQEVLLISRMDLESYVGLLSTFVKKPLTHKTIMSTWKRALEENLGEVDMNKRVSELVQARLGLPVKNKILQLTLKEISQLGGKKLKEFRQALYKDLLHLRSFAQEERIEVVKDKNSEFGWKPARKGTRKVWWKFGDTFEYGWIPLEVMP